MRINGKPTATRRMNAAVSILLCVSLMVAFAATPVFAAAPALARLDVSAWAQPDADVDADADAGADVDADAAVGGALSPVENEPGEGSGETVAAERGAVIAAGGGGASGTGGGGAIAEEPDLTPPPAPDPTSPTDPTSGEPSPTPTEPTPPPVSVPTIATQSLPGGIVSVAYSQALAADGETPITWSLVRGALPDGLTLAQDGAITGMPEVAGIFDFTVRATNSLGFDDKELSIRISDFVDATYAEAFPDANFRAAVLELLNEDGDWRTSGSMVTEADQAAMAAYEYLSISSRGIADLTGIEHFTGLLYLDCYNNQLAELDVTSNTALIYLDCDSNQLSELDLSNNVVLDGLDCQNNQLAVLDVTNNVMLRILYCSGNQLTGLDVSNNAALIDLFCYSNQLTELDVSSNAALIYLNCYDNQIIALDVSNNAALLYLYCEWNRLTELDVNHNAALTTLSCDWNQLSELDVSNNSALTSLDCGINQLSELDVSNNSVLINLNCTGNQLYELDLSHNLALTSIICGSSQLSELDVSNNPALTDLYCEWNQLTELDVSHNPALTSLDCVGNLLVELDVSNNATLTYLDCRDNYIPSPSYVTGWQELGLIINSPDNQYSGTFLFYPQRFPIPPTITTQSLPNGVIGVAFSQSLAAEGDAPITWSLVGGALPDGLVLAQNGAITGIPEAAGVFAFTVRATNSLGFDDKELSIIIDDLIDATYAEAFPNANFRAAVLELLNADGGVRTGGSMVTGADQVAMAAYTSLSISSRGIADLTGIEHFTVLTNLDCHNNQLAELDVSSCASLIYLLCYYNQLDELDVSNNTALFYLDCGGNRLSELDLSNNVALYHLDCRNNQLAELDVSNNTFIESLICYSNQLTGLYVSNSISLVFLECYYNQLAVLDVTNNAALTYLDCGYNQLTELDVSNNTALDLLFCYNNQLTELEVSSCASLMYLDCSYNYLASPNDVVGWQELGLIINSPDNPYSGSFTFYPQYAIPVLIPPTITTLGLPGGVMGVAYSQALAAAGDSPITWSLVGGALPDGLALAQDGAITGMPETVGVFEFTVRATNSLGFDDKELSISINDFVNATYAEVFPDANFRAAVLELLNADGGGRMSISMVTGADQAAMAAYTSLFVSNRGITDLTGIEHFTGLTNLDCYYNQLAELDVSSNTALIYLDCGGNRLSELDLSNNAALEYLYCYSNQFTELDVSSYNSLRYLNCLSNKLTELDVSNNSALVYLNCTYNNMSSLSDVIGWQERGLVVNSPENPYSGTFLFYPQRTPMPPTIATQSLPGGVVGVAYSQALVATGDTPITWSLVGGALPNGLALAQNGTITGIPEAAGIFDFTVRATNSLGFNDKELSIRINAFVDATYAEAFPDANFRAAVLELLNADSGGRTGGSMVTGADQVAMAAYDYLSVTSRGIADLTGIEHFTELLYLSCYGNHLIKLDMSSNAALRTLYCYNNQLTELDVSSNPALEYLYCYNNQLTELDVSNCASLTNLDCTDNYMASPSDVVGWQELGLIINSPDNPYSGTFRFYPQRIPMPPTITTLGLPGGVVGVAYNRALAATGEAPIMWSLVEGALPDGFALAQNGEITGMPETAGMFAFTVRATNSLGFDDKVLSIRIDGLIDATYAEAFPDANFRAVVIDRLNIDGGMRTGGSMVTGADQATIAAYTSLSVSNRGIADLTGIEHFTGLSNLFCDYNQLTELDVSSNTALLYLDCGGNRLSELDLSNNAALYHLNCRNNQLAELDLSNNAALIDLDCSYNQLTELDMTNNTTLRILYCFNNQLTELDVSNNPALTDLDCSYNQLTELDVTHNAALLDLDCMDNQLAELDVSNNASLRYLYCYYNQLAELDVYSNTTLLYIDCDSNRLSELDLSNNAELYHLDCRNNQLAKLDVSDNAALRILYCMDNQLAELDVSNCTALEYLDCSYNYIASPNDVVGWQELGLIINSPENPYSGTFRFYPQSFPMPPTITTLGLSGGVVGVAYNRALAATGEAPITWSLVGGTLPDGLALAQNGTITGIPEVAGVFTFTVRATNGLGFDDKELSIRISDLIDATYAEAFPDVNFRAAVLELLNMDGGGRTGGSMVTGADQATMAAYTSFYISGRGIADLTGIEHFAGLLYLYCYYNQLAELDVSNNTALVFLDCEENQLTELDVSNNPALTTLYCSYNQLAELDVSSCASFMYLDCTNNYMASPSDVVGWQELGLVINSPENPYSGTFRFYPQSFPMPPTITTLGLQGGIVGLAYNRALAATGHAPITWSIVGGALPDGLALAQNGTITGMPDTAGVFTFTVRATNGLGFDDKELSIRIDSPIDATFAEAFPDANFREVVLALLNADGGGRTGGSMITVADQAAMAAYTSLSLYSRGIADLTGIEHFAGLLYLYCYYNQLTELDVSNNAALIYLDCDGNRLSKLDLSNNVVLDGLDCRNNQLTELDVSNNTSLTSLICYGNQLTELDVSNNISLVFLDCYYNQLVELDVSDNAMLENLYCDDNQLTALDLSNNIVLTNLWCMDNQLTELDVSNNAALEYLYCFYNQLAELDVSSCASLVYLDCTDNYISSPSDVVGWQELGLIINSPENPYSGTFRFYPQRIPMPPTITTLGLPGGIVGVAYSQALAAAGDSPITWSLVEGALPDGLALAQNGTITGMPKNTGVFTFTVRATNSLGFDDKELSIRIDSPIDATFAEAFPDANFREVVLALLNADGGGRTGGSMITVADQAAMATYTSLSLFSRGIADLTGIEHFAGLLYLYCYYNQLAELDVTNNTALLYLDCDGNRLSELDLSHNTALEYLYCYGNQLSELDMSNNVELVYLYCADNQLTELDVSNNESLEYLYCYYNQLTELNVSSNAELLYLYCFGNQLTELDVSNNGSLRYLYCFYNQLVELDVSNNTMLLYLDCDGNRLSELDLSNNAALYRLDCRNNQLTALDLSNNTALTNLWCMGNQLVELDVSNNAVLLDLYCYNNQLTELDVSNNAALEYLYCFYNQLTELDVSSCTALEYLDCSYNYISSPSDVAGWQELGLIINSPENPYNGTFLFYPQYAIPVTQPPTITTLGLPGGVVGVAYSQVLAAEGDEPITWSLVGGALPDDLALAQNGAITGMPSALPGMSTYTFTVRAENEGGFDEKELSIVVRSFDANGDGVFDIADISTVIYNYYMINTSDPRWPEASVFDMDGNGMIDVADLLIMLVYMG